MAAVSIYDYLNYCNFLRDIFQAKKGEKKSFSHRAVLQRMGVTSSGYLANVISGKSSLSIEGATKLSKIFNLNKAETSYFKKLIYFHKAKTIDEKNDIFKQLIAFRKRELKLLEKDQLFLFSEWYIIVIRELMHFCNINDDYSALAKMLSPPVSSREAQKAVDTLKKMGLIKKNSEGYYKPVDKAITTGDEVDSFHVVNFQLKMIEIVKECYSRINSEERDISGLTLSISKEKFKLIKEEIQEFRKRLLQIAVDDQEPQQVIRCNFQIFPVTKVMDVIDKKKNNKKGTGK